MTPEQTKFLIVGAGPTGLGAGWRLTELGERDWLIVEGNQAAGGLATSIRDNKGFLWDLGPHFLYSHYDYFDQILDSCLENEWTYHKREASVWLRDRFIPYPLQNNIWRLPASDLVACLDGLLAVHNKPATEAASDCFEDWLLRSFGKGLAEVFFLPYNFKVWAYPPSSLSACWIQERVATVDLSRILRNLVLREDDLGWGPNATFRYPLRGGTGAIWQRIYQKLPRERKLMNSTVVAIEPCKRRIQLADGTFIQYEYLISSIPLNQLLLMWKDKPEMIARSESFRYSSTNLIGLGLKGQPPEQLRNRFWIYFVEDQFPFYRVTIFSNYASASVPSENYWSLLCEVSESPVKPVDRDTLKGDVIKALKEIDFIGHEDDIASVWETRLEYGYPTPFLNRDCVIGPIEQELSGLNIFSRGRFGAWKYEVSNQDHSFMQGVEAINHILFGSEEITYHQPSVVNSGERALAYSLESKRSGQLRADRR